MADMASQTASLLLGITALLLLLHMALPFIPAEVHALVQAVASTHRPALSAQHALPHLPTPRLAPLRVTSHTAARTPLHISEVPAPFHAATCWLGFALLLVMFLLAVAGQRLRLNPTSMALGSMTGTKEVKEEPQGGDTSFIHRIIQDDVAAGLYEGRVATRFPPEPNGHLHLGHAKSICLNFRLAEQFHGTCNLRFDDTNPEKEGAAFVESIKEDVAWLGFQWDGPVRYASDYFPQLYAYAVKLVREGKAFVCSLSFEQAHEYRGTLTSPGKNSPDRDRSVEENLRLLEEMKEGRHPEGSYTLRLKIDMASPIISMRDPVIYRIKFATHHRTGDVWCIYPMYDFTHCISDALEGITHSLCTLEFEGNRPLYEWVLNALRFDRPPKQREFARLNMSHWIMSKRHLTRLVDSKAVSGWDDPRLPTLKGLRRRGYTPSSVQAFIAGLAISKSDSVIPIEQLEAAIRAELEWDAPRRMVVLDPLKVTICTFPASDRLVIPLANHPSVESQGTRDVGFAREIYIDRADFSPNPPKGFKRLTPSNAVRLRGSFVIRLKEVVYGPQGEVQELICEHDPETLGKNPVGYKAQGVIHWVSVASSPECVVNLYDKLFSVEKPGAGDVAEELNPNSLQVVPLARMEGALAEAVAGQRFQFERQGYFVVDSVVNGKAVFNRICSLKEGW
eukprot:GGOE01043445.1.p1 GENE.GGOE01043445.1~~GGOE01043445.1.p1  ORF type:complete len:697 (+),score=200.92 GGOE01043445.1:59-2092(+)